jgi:hypothetical protein
MRFSLDVAQANDQGFRDVRKIGQFKPVFLSFRAFPGALCALRTDCSPAAPATASGRNF